MVSSKTVDLDFRTSSAIREITELITRTFLPVEPNIRDPIGNKKMNCQFIHIVMTQLPKYLMEDHWVCDKREQRKFVHLQTFPVTQSRGHEAWTKRDAITWSRLYLESKACYPSTCCADSKLILNLKLVGTTVSACSNENCRLSIFFLFLFLYQEKSLIYFIIYLLVEAGGRQTYSFKIGSINLHTWETANQNARKLLHIWWCFSLPSHHTLCIEFTNFYFTYITGYKMVTTRFFHGMWNMP